ncbi:hypothetical protein ACTU6U_12855, partial [Microbacterium sp. A196]|uniref:hypothetical protein n=1 Tax=Microbacterium sp. A196 TaxID=3457320 RepID=UPI003FD0DFD0
MAITSLTPGQSYVGLLIDGVTGTPYTGATLRMEDRGPVVDVPYISHDETGTADGLVDSNAVRIS